MKINLFIHIDIIVLKEWFFYAWAYVINVFNSVCGAIKTFLVALLSDYTSTWITSTTIQAIGEVISLVTTAFVFIVIFVFIWRGIGILLTKLIEVAFLKTGDGISFIIKETVYRVFASVAWIFNSLANGIRKVLFN